MKIEIHWPDEQPHTVDLGHTDVGQDSLIFQELLSLSYKYDVIIDNGVISFVEKS